MRFLLALLLVVVSSVVMSGCATQGHGNTTTGIDESRFNKTIVGGLAGGAGGATIGLLAADNAAEGIAIGAISGAIIGAGIGAILAKNDSENDSLNETSYQQSEKIKQQQKDIDYLRSRDAEKPSTRTEGNGVGEENLMLNPPPDSAGKNSQDLSKAEPSGDISGIKPKLVKNQAAPASIANESSARPAMSSKYSFDENRPSGSRSSTSAAAVATSTTAAAAATTTVTPSKSDSAENSAKSVSPKADQKSSDPTKPDIAPTLKKVTPEAPVTATSVVPPTGQAGCKEAVKEAEQGLKSSSDADRLFYLRRASRLCPSEPTYHVELGRMLSSLGKSNEAKQELKHALTLDPKNQAARDELSIVENSTGRK